MYIIALGRYYEITISLKIHVMDFNSSSGQHALSLVGKVRLYNANWSICTFSLLQNGRVSSGTFTIWRWRSINCKSSQRRATVTLSQTMLMLYNDVERMKTLVMSMSASKASRCQSIVVLLLVLQIFQTSTTSFDDVKWSGITLLFVVECRQRDFEFHASGPGMFLAPVLPSVLHSTPQVKV